MCNKLGFPTSHPYFFFDKLNNFSKL